MRMDRPSPIETLRAGVEVLRPVLEPHGFIFHEGAAGASSGGAFASGTFERGERKIEISFRYSLGLVRYRIGASVIDHENFLRLSGQWSSHKYPDFGGTPINSFTALASDLSAFFADFLSGPGEHFKAVVAEYAANPNRFKGLGAVGKR